MTYEIPAAVARRFQDTRRVEVRLQAAADAAALIRDCSQWTAADLRQLLRHLQTDWYKGKQVKNRFSPGLTGQHEKWLLDALEGVGQWLRSVRDAAARGLSDDVAAGLLTEFWSADLPGMRIFPTAVLAAIDPQRFVAFTKPSVAALNAIVPGASFSKSKDATEYMNVCRAVRAICEAQGWPLCLVDAALHVDTQRPARDSFSGYSRAAVQFLEALPDHTRDPAWHAEHRDTYERELRDPTAALVDAIAARHVAALDAAVAAAKRPISVLKKNDFGADTYHAHYWFAFYDPAAKTKTESVQLFGWFSGARKLVRYGVGMGDYGRVYLDNVLAALRGALANAATFVEQLPRGILIRLEFKDGTERIHPPGDLAKALRDGTLDAFLAGSSTLIDLSFECQATLTTLVERGVGLADDIGRVFVAVWPLFEAARTGTFRGGAETPPSPIEGDEDAPESIAELGQETSLAEDMLAEIEDALLAKGQLILVGPPGTSKTYVAEQFARYFVRYQSGIRPQGQHRMLYMHASWAYEDFFEGIRPRIGGAGLEFAHHRGAFLSWVEDVVAKGPAAARYIMVLDEINRCDTAAVLGELLQLMEYRGQQIQLLSGRPFVVPRNMYLIGTMNSADRSIGRIDLALRRRFLFIDLPPDPDVLQTWLDVVPERNACGLDAEALRQCNAWLEREHRIPRDQQVGHALFMPSSQNSHGAPEIPLTGPALRRIVRYSVLPYVRELLVERGRDVAPALKTVEGFFEKYYEAADDPAEP